jgi:hypothetical protein
VTKTLSTLGLVFAFALTSTVLMQAQDKPAATTTPKPSGAEMPLKIQVLISRYQGDKKISSLPYSLSVTGGGGPERAALGPHFLGRANLRMGARVPIASTSYTPIATGGAGVNPLVSYQYQDVGTSIDCQVWSMEDGRFRVEITIDDSSVYPDDKDIPGAVKGNPSLRSFRGSDSMLLKDGATAQFTTATDKVNGETVKVDVTLTAVK